jgi:hypothetical protein
MREVESITGVDPRDKRRGDGGRFARRRIRKRSERLTDFGSGGTVRLPKERLC